MTRTLPAATALAATALLAGCLAGAGAPAMQTSRAEASEAFELWLTDAPANVTSLHLVVATVEVGGVPLDIVQDAFDLLAHRGPEQAILIARGFVPPAQRDHVEVAFAAAVAVVDGVPLPVPAASLSWTSPQQTLSGPLLLDIDAARSLVPTAQGLAFAPVVQKAYLAPPAGAAPQQDPLLDSTSWQPPAPMEAQDALPGAGTAASGTVPIGQAAAAGGLLPGVAGIADDGSPLLPEDPLADLDLGLPPLADGPAQGAPDAGRVGYIIRFHDRAAAMADNELAEAGAVVIHRFASVPAAYVLTTPEDAARLSMRAKVAHVEPDTPIVLHDAQSRQALRVTNVQHPLTGLKDAQGQPIDGRGIGVAVIDTGIDATHPDLQHVLLQPTGPVVKNLKFAEAAATDLPNTDTTSGHGTHVASIVAGRGIADPTVVGVAPGAKLYGLGIGEAPRLLWAAQALDWVAQNHATVQPPIRVVQNSWSTPGGYDPNSIVNILVNGLVADDVVVVFSAGNDGGDGSTAMTSSYCRNPTPGVVCVAAFDDLGTGTRDGKVAPYSSRGKTTSSVTWPDVSAPGTAVLAARPAVGWTTGVAYPTPYIELSGTSQAAPHVSGVVALMLQADPALSAAGVESILKSTAYKFADGGAYATTTNPATNGGHFAKGHGLVDAYAAVQAALT